MTRIACLDDKDTAPVSVATTLRNRVNAAFLARQSQGEVIEATAAELAAALQELSDRGLLWFRREDGAAGGRVTVDHIPSSETARALSGGGAWPDAIAKRVAKAIRSTAGALFRFPGEGEGADIDVFITDWSPCPGACAIAVHRYHSFVAETQATVGENGAAFTGRFVRHPLTGDLLPVWVADWVKPDFGTGAVLVNPAHDAVDLAFGRRIGLPIRFALMPDGASDEPEAWPGAPVIRTGRATKTGRWDGLSVDEARAAYRETLLARDLARDHTDIRLPAATIATLEPDEDGGWLWFPRDGRVERAPAEPTPEPAAIRMRLEPDAALSCAAVAARADILLLSATAQKRSAVALAGLVGDLCGSRMPEIVVTQSADYAGVPPDATEVDRAMALAFLVAGDPGQSVAIRKQLLEQTTGFFAAADAIAARLAENGVEPPKTVAAALHRADPVAGFRDLHKWQKDMLKTNSAVAEEPYRSVYWLLTGVETTDVG